MGINLGEDSPYSGATLTKIRAVENFEGALLRQCHFGPISSADGMSTWFGCVGRDWDIFALSNDVVLLSGPQQWERRKVVEVLEREFMQGGKTNKPNQSHTFPTIWSYAFKDGNRRGLILFNLDTSKTNPVKIEFLGKVQGDATQYAMTADKIDANNEHETPEPQVKISETKLDKFVSGTVLNLPPHSMIVLDWKVK